MTNNEQFGSYPQVPASAAGSLLLDVNFFLGIAITAARHEIQVSAKTFGNFFPRLSKPRKSLTELQAADTPGRPSQRISLKASAQISLAEDRQFGA